MAVSPLESTKPHFLLLDALRGVAALLVVWYHIFEGYSFAGGDIIRGINHGYLAVDFFFILSGFVIGYAYDDRWAEGFTLKQFFKRRLIRLHPMVIFGAVVGLVTFLIQGGVQWDGTRVATSAVMWALLLAMFMIPAVPGWPNEVRGNGEMFPLNGPTWSLFFEYIGNILYALALRRMSDRALKVLTAVLGVALGVFALFNVSGYGSIGVGWTLDGLNFVGGMLRMMFPFTLGMYISRTFRPCRVKGAFWICSAVLLAVFYVPYLPWTCSLGRFFGLEPTLTANGAFEILCIAGVFPLLVRIAASAGQTGTGVSDGICRVLGNLSFPLYLVHYPIMYLFYAYLIRTCQYSFAQTWPLALCVYAGCVAFGFLSSRFYDKPVRKWLKKLLG